MDPNEVLTEIRTLASKVSQAVEQARRFGVTDELPDLAMSLASRVWLLDGHLSAGGVPPEVWREGPDAVAVDRDGVDREDPNHPHWVAADTDHVAKPDEDGDNCTVCGLAVASPWATRHGTA